MSLEKSIKYVCIKSNTSIKEIAQQLGMSEGGLRRSIKDEKLTFSKIDQIAINNSLTASEFIELGETK